MSDRTVAAHITFGQVTHNTTMVYSKDAFSASIDDANSQTLTVAATKADYVYVTIDDGTSGSNPAQYTLTLEKDTVELGSSTRQQYVLEEATRTDLSWRFEAVGGDMSITITNTSGSTATFEAEAEARISGGD